MGSGLPQGRQFGLVGRQVGRAQQRQQGRTDQQHALRVGQPAGQQQLGQPVDIDGWNLEEPDEPRIEQGVEGGRQQQRDGQKTADRIQPVLGRFPFGHAPQQADGLPGTGQRRHGDDQGIAGVLRGQQGPRTGTAGSHRQPADAVVPAKGKAHGGRGPDQQVPRRAGRDQLGQCAQRAGKSRGNHTAYRQGKMLEIGQALQTGSSERTRGAGAGLRATGRVMRGLHDEAAAEPVRAGPDRDRTSSTSALLQKSCGGFPMPPSARAARRAGCHHAGSSPPRSRCRSATGG